LFCRAWNLYSYVINLAVLGPRTRLVRIWTAEGSFLLGWRLFSLRLLARVAGWRARVIDFILVYQHLIPFEHIRGWMSFQSLVLVIDNPFIIQNTNRLIPANCRSNSALLEKTENHGIFFAIFPFYIGLPSGRMPPLMRIGSFIWCRNDPVKNEL
jgi:hypothetical protein